MEPESGSVEEILREAAPEAACIAVAIEIGWSKEQVANDPAGALELAVAKLPSTGQIRKKKDCSMVNALSRLVAEVPQDHERHDALTSLVEDAMDRVR